MFLSCSEIHLGTVERVVHNSFEQTVTRTCEATKENLILSKPRSGPVPGFSSPRPRLTLM